LTFLRPGCGGSASYLDRNAAAGCASPHASCLLRRAPMRTSCWSATVAPWQRCPSRTCHSRRGSEPPSGALEVLPVATDLHYGCPLGKQALRQHVVNGRYLQSFRTCPSQQLSTISSLPHRQLSSRASRPFHTEETRHCCRYSPHPHPMLKDASFLNKGCACWATAVGAAPAMASWLDGGAAPGVVAGTGLEMCWAAATTVSGFGALPSRSGARCVDHI
jgi:hypothetical protein